MLVMIYSTHPVHGGAIGKIKEVSVIEWIRMKMTGIDVKIMRLINRKRG
jgi:hypothetical protein